MPLRNARFLLIAGALATALLGGCDSTGVLQSRHKPATQIYEQLPLDVNPVVAALQLISELPQRDPAGQAELFQAAKDAADLTPTTSNKLKFALALATPGHSGSDPVAAQRHLAELLATPENLLPIEHYLAQSQLQQVERQLVLDAENRSLRDAAPREARDKLASVNHRLAAETDENAKLRKELDDARAKLEAVSHIERSINDRNSTATGSPKP
jgi:hypothetical protein